MRFRASHALCALLAVPDGPREGTGIWASSVSRDPAPSRSGRVWSLLCSWGSGPENSPCVTAAYHRNALFSSSSSPHPAFTT